MFKRIIYTAMFLVSVVALVFLFALPIYKFDDEAIKSNYVETIARILDDDIDKYREDPIAYKELTAEEKAKYKNKSCPQTFFIQYLHPYQYRDVL